MFYIAALWLTSLHFQCQVTRGEEHVQDVEQLGKKK